MREIKFRAWAEKTTNNRWNYAYDKAKVEYRSRLNSLNIDELEADFTEDEIREKYYSEFDTLNLEANTLTKEMITDITVNGDKVTRPYGYEVLAIMQYTGLKDKNGKEIYEGDVIKIGKNLREEGNLAEVVWYRGGMMLHLKRYFGHRNIESYDGDCEKHEIIGNIYENPELIK